MMRIALIYNPFAGFGRAKKLLPGVRQEFGHASVKLDLLLTRYRGHATELVRELDLTAYDAVVAAGGDGTLFEVINGYFRNSAKTKPPVGVLPVGTGNAFVRDMGLDKKSRRRAVAIICAGSVRMIDIARYTCGDTTRYFHNVLGFGLVTDIGETAQKVKFLGNVAYTVGVFHRLLGMRTNRARIEFDGRSIERENLFIEVSNTRYTSNFLIAPQAKIDDGLLDVTLVGSMSRIKLLRAFPKIFDGSHVHLPEVETFTAHRLCITTDTPKRLSPDGELLDQTPVEITCLRQALPVFWPEEMA